jgi:transcriptional regulator with XRE-family HTH domain
MTDRGDDAADRDALELAERLKEQRTFLNLSQQFVAEQTGIPRSAISDIERGARRVESTELKRFAEVYRMPASYFLGEQDELDASSDDPTVSALARAAGGLTETDKQEVLRFARFLENYKRKEDDG